MITLFALIRLIPYAFVIYLAWRKGYPRLAIGAGYLILIAMTVFVFHPNDDIRAVMGATTALLLLWHAGDLVDKSTIGR